MVGLVGAADDRVTVCIVLAASREPNEKDVKGYMQDTQGNWDGMGSGDGVS